MENCQCLIKLKIHISYDSAIPTLDTHPGERYTHIHQNSGAKVFKVVLFVIVLKMETVQLESTVEWIHKLWPIYAVDYYTGRKKESTNHKCTT